MKKFQAKQKEELEEVRRRKKAQPIYGQLKQTAEPEDNCRARALLSDHTEAIGNDQGAEQIIRLQQTYGNKYIQRMAEEGKESNLDEDIIYRIKSQRGSGKSLEPQVRSDLEVAFRHDFRQVRVHTNAEAQDLSRELGAKAFTVGKDIFFRESIYQPSSEAGGKLVGHELAHVVQQDSGTITSHHVLDASTDYLEAEADAAGRAVVSGEGVTLSSGDTVPSIQLQKADPEVEKKPVKTTKDPKEVLRSVFQAAIKTDKGKRAIERLFGKGVTAEVGIAILSTFAEVALAASFAEKMEVPKAAVDLVPKLAKVELGKGMEIAFQPIYKGKVGEKPKEWGGMVTFTIKEW